MREIALPTSKSILIRKLFVNYLYFNEIDSIGTDIPEDVNIVFKNICFIKEKQCNKVSVNKIDVGECGAAYRFFMALLSITEGDWLLTGTERLLQRPIRPLVDALKSVGADICESNQGWLIHGKNLQTEKIRIDASKSSQFVSALLIISGKINLKKIEITNNRQASKSYIYLTDSILEKIGIKISHKDKEIDIRRTALEKCEIEEEADWSAAAYWYAIAALTRQEFLLLNLKTESRQPDKRVAELFLPFGVASEQTERGILIRFLEKYSRKIPRTIDLSNNPDIAPVFTSFCALAGESVTLTGLSTLNDKESKRIDVLQEELSPFCRIDNIDNQKIVITPRQDKPLKGRELHFHSHGDHRMVMAFSLFSIYYNTEIQGFDSVKKSYPSFREGMAK